MTAHTMPIEARRALVQQTAQQVLDLCRAHARDGVDEATTLGVLQAWLSDFARHTGEIRDRATKDMKTAPDDPFITQPERVAEIAQRAFGDAKDAALAENERLGIKSYGTVTDPPKPDRA